MISGYFIRPNTNEIQPKSLLKNVGKYYKKVWFYSVAIAMAFCITGTIKFTDAYLFKSIFPIMTNQYWFMTVFLLLTYIRPFIGKMLSQLTLKELVALIGVLAFFDTVQSVIESNAFMEKGTGFLHAIFMLILGYSIGQISWMQPKKRHAIALYLGSCVLAGIIAIIKKIVFNAADAKAIFYNSPLMVLASVGIFSFFSQVSCSTNYISKFAPHVLAI